MGQQIKEYEKDARFKRIGEIEEEEGGVHKIEYRMDFNNVEVANTKN